MLSKNCEINETRLSNILYRIDMSLLCEFDDICKYN